MPPLKTAAKIDCRDSGYFAREIRHLGRHPERGHGSSRVGEWRKKMCAARGGRRVAAHESSEHRGSCSRFHDVASQKASPVGVLEQSPCQTAFML
jgi:hypothetical protein